MFGRLMRKVKGKGKWIGALAMSAALLAPVGAGAKSIDPGIGIDLPCGECSFAYDGELSGNLDLTLQVMGVADLEAYITLVSTEIDVKNPGMRVAGLVRALSKNDQFLMFNEERNRAVRNSASLTGEVLKNAQGNIGANVAAGDFNAQSNIAAIAAGKQETSLVESKTFSVQKSMYNFGRNRGTQNTASAGDEVLKNAKGNIGLNVAAGANNAQTNQLGAAVGPARVGAAVAYVQQKSLYNAASNKPITERFVRLYRVRLGLSAAGSTSGARFSGVYSGAEGGTVTGTVNGHSYQSNNFYPDIWTGSSHTSGTQIGHVDLDNEIQGAVPNPFKQGVGGIAFDNYHSINGRYSGKESGRLGGTIGAQRVRLTGTVTGYIPVVMVRRVDTINTASLSGQVLMNAVGNIGVNIAAGSNNLQANSLSVVALPATSSQVPTPTPGGGTE
ncbi:MAG TPA: hypothetical protein ENJ40_04015 [Thermosulfurimonas dismutans]|uniref:Uncharacterized protein n=1 Tax=Thermosulfurimonas dismutans TaxID=999894 RepID=A0A7C3CL64_9BACT|nr:hypothetical protein [Thermosulfurimonas dismutans]